MTTGPAGPPPPHWFQTRPVLPLLQWPRCHGHSQAWQPGGSWPSGLGVEQLVLGTSTATKGWPAGDVGRPPPDSISGGWVGCWGPGGKWPFLG